MENLRQLLAGLGSPGAVRNARSALLVREAEDRAIQRLTDHLTRHELPALVRSAA